MTQLTDPEQKQVLVKQFAKAQRALKRRAFLLVAPLLLFLILVFIVPIGLILINSVSNDVIKTLLPQTTQLLKQWQDESAVPENTVYATLATELMVAKAQKQDGKIATRLNYEQSGLRSLIKKTTRKLKKVEPPYTKAAMIKIDKRWGKPTVWQIIKRESGLASASFYIAALDLQYNPEGNIESRPENRSIYLALFERTFIISIVVTLLCALLGFPVAYLLASVPTKVANLLMILVLLPFWTSLLVRTTSWIVLLQTQGPLNDLLVWMGFIEDGERIRMIYNMAGTLIAMTHILLPFMILPTYSVMKNIPPTYMRAAFSLGAGWWYAFRRVYLPLTIPGLGAGGLLVFILSIGYYITPALVGGSSGQLISNFIAYHLQQSLNWGLAAALSGILLALVLILYWVYNRFFGIERLKF